MKIFPQFLGRLNVQDETVLVIIAVVAFLGCVGIAAYVGWYVYRWSSAKKWARVQGNLIQFSEVTNKFGSGLPKIKIRYAYNFDGENREGTTTQLGLHRDRPFSGDIIHSLRQAQLSGGKINIFVDPQRPARSSINVCFDRKGVASLAIVALLALVPVLMWISFQ
jgi:hypothetical protein